MLIIKVIQRVHLGWDGKPTDWIPIYVQRDTQTLVLPKRVSVACVPQAFEGNTVFGYPVLVHTSESGTYPMCELDFMKPGDEVWLADRHAHLLKNTRLVKVARPMLDSTAGFSFKFQDVEVVE